MKPTPHRRLSLTRHRWSLWTLPAFGLLLIAAVWASTLLQLQATERSLLDGTTWLTERLAAEFEEYTRRAIKDADRTALVVKREFELQGKFDLTGLVRAGLLENDENVLVIVADANGDVIASSRPTAQFNIADREYFQQHAQHDTGVLDISKPVAGRVSGRSTILLSRRLNQLDGSYAGIVLVSVTARYFMAFYQESELGAEGSLGLLGLDGIYRARSVGGEATTVPDQSGPKLTARANASPAGHYESQGDFDRVTRIVAYRKLADYPFIVTVARSKDEALTGFHQDRRGHFMVAAVATVAILVFFAIVTVLAMRLQRHRGDLKVQRRFLQTLFDNVPSGITVRSMRSHDDGKYVLWNESNALMFGVKPEDALGKTAKDVIPAGYAEEILELDHRLLASPMVQNVVQVREMPGERPRIYNLIRTPIFDDHGAVDYIMTSVTDITEERERNDQLTLASKVFETTVDGIMLSDANDRIVMINAAFSRLTGYDAQEMVGITLNESPFRPIDVAESKVRSESLQRDGYVTGEVPRFRKDGTPLALWVTASCVRNPDNSIRNYVRVFTDISLLKETQKELEQLASFDTLTELPNRRLLQDRLVQGLLRAERRKVSMAVMFVDLDGFKGVNDTLGHDVGDLLLREVARRLSTCIRASDTIGRIGGDEFAVILEDALLPGDAEQIGERIVAAFAAPFMLKGQLVRISASIGIAIYPQDGVDGESLLKNADVAMYKAKRKGCNRFEFYAEAREPEPALH